MHRAFLVQGLPPHFPDLYSPTDAAPQFCRNLSPLFIIYSIVMKQYITSITQHQKTRWRYDCFVHKQVCLNQTRDPCLVAKWNHAKFYSISYDEIQLFYQNGSQPRQKHCLSSFFQSSIWIILLWYFIVILSWATSPSGGSWPSVMDQTVMHFFIFRQKLCEIEITMPLQRFTPSGSYSGKCGTAKKP